MATYAPDAKSRDREYIYSRKESLVFLMDSSECINFNTY